MGYPRDKFFGTLVLFFTTLAQQMFNHVILSSAIINFLLFRLLLTIY
ncbi:hypothetical protein M917_0524 [Psychrobacter aquaticus CMS 56]|uniref:Uncharacterized protein n=1 Tax=Psychrobacter aquaticus CMS 56 TaxID=1354303 RepID=U4TDG0_9GAMM|nr:hypothetical protein M917_0524 [Psychrobacter aquaticus CMS 56]